LKLISKRHSALRGESSNRSNLCLRCHAKWPIFVRLTMLRRRKTLEILLAVDHQYQPMTRGNVRMITEFLLDDGVVKVFSKKEI